VRRDTGESYHDFLTTLAQGVVHRNTDDGDTTTSIETLIDAAEQVETLRPDGKGIEEVVGDKGYHSNQSLIDLEAVGIPSSISEPDRGRRNWKKNPEAREAVYRNRRRILGAPGLRLLRLSGERHAVVVLIHALCMRSTRWSPMTSFQHLTRSR